MRRRSGKRALWAGHSGPLASVRVILALLIRRVQGYLLRPQAHFQQGR